VPAHRIAILIVRAFSSEVDTGSREENAKKQKDRAGKVNVNSPKML
jgi:hypothetical protein